jgi:uncharacterized protein YgbK (DUF1537 family)
MRFAFYGDDFTGSVDALLQFRLAGLEGVLVTGAQAVADARASGADVIGVAGVARSLPTASMAAEVRPALRELLVLGPQVIQYKACSTADSSPRTGSLGNILEIAREMIPCGPVPVCFAQPGFGRYTFFGQHFARDGDAVYRLDRQPTMRSHPVTPATEADLCRMLATQTSLPLATMSWLSYQRQEDVAAALDRDDVAAVVCDAFTDAHLDQLASAILADPRRPRFVLGAGGISAALGRMAGPGHRLPPLARDVGAADRPVLVLSGSTSRRTAAQTEQAVAHRWTALGLFGPRIAREAAARLARGENVIVTSARGPAGAVGHIDDALAEVASACLDREPNVRVILCGGDTSGRVLRRLGVRALTIEAAPWGNVALCRAQRDGNADFDVVLKGGQMGSLTLFEDVRKGSSTAGSPETTEEKP